MRNKNTKIVCTLGPSSNSTTEICKLISAGMDVARLNFSHGTYPEHQEIINNLHKAEKISQTQIALLQDLQGPKIRTGQAPKTGLAVTRGDKLILTAKKITGGYLEEKNSKSKTAIISTQYKNLYKDLKPGDNILIDDGLIEVHVEKIVGKDIICKVKNKGLIKTYKGISVPGATISAKTITAKDKLDLAFGLKNKVEYIALSFVKDKKDIQELQELIKSHKTTAKIIAKIERPEAVQNLEEIIHAADGVMVARGDLGINMPPEQVPLIQKRIIKIANLYGKPVITATQVLQSMVESPVATRAEISDAANAIFDHTDAIMLSNESAVGQYPDKAVRTLTKVAKTVEQELQQYEELISPDIMNKNLIQNILTENNAACLNACELALDIRGNLIVVYTDDGYTARQISKHRLYIPIITITPSARVARELKLIWGLNQIFVHKIDTKNSENILKFLKKNKLVKKKDKIVIICNASKKEKLISSLII